MATDIAPTTGQADDPEPAVPATMFYYSPYRYLQTMLAIAWSAFAHPFSTTVIDLATGAVSHGVNEDEE